MADKLKAAVIGCGAASRVNHIPWYANHPDKKGTMARIKLSALADSFLGEELEQIAERFSAWGLDGIEGAECDSEFQQLFLWREWDHLAAIKAIKDRMVHLGLELPSIACHWELAGAKRESNLAYLKKCFYRTEEGVLQPYGGHPQDASLPERFDLGQLSVAKFRGKNAITKHLG